MSLVSQTHYIVDYGAEYVTHYYLKIVNLTYFCIINYQV